MPGAGGLALVMRDPRPGEVVGAPELEAAAWPDSLNVPIEPSRPRIAPGVYVARSVRAEKFELRGWGRRFVLWFDVFERDPLDSATRTLARVPAYFRLPIGRPLRATSKLARVLDLVDRRSRRLDRIPLRVLRDRLWRVEVRDVVTTSEKNRDGSGNRPLQQSQQYSVVSEILEHLA